MKNYHLEQKLISLASNKHFKRLIVIIGSIFLIGSIFIAIDPEPFKKTGYAGVFFYGILGPVTLIIPIMSQSYNLIILSLVASAGVCINDTLAYIVGRNTDAFIEKTNKVRVVEKYVNRYGFLALLGISILPIPYDFIGILVGYLDLNYKKYILPLFIGKFIRFILVGLGTSLVL